MMSPYVNGLFCLFCCLFLSCKQQQDSPKTSYVDALAQINAGAMLEAGLSGKGVKIGIIDLGFAGLPQNPVTRRLLEENQIKFIRQYYPDSQAVFFNHAENHGFIVTFMIGGMSRRDSLYGGALARDAEFYLAKVGKSSFENTSLSDEENSIGMALEDFYQRGVRLVNLSLGFWDDFDDESLNYLPGQMDGKTSRIARICQEYIQKGMIIVAAAGNTGEYRWRIVWTPADVEDVITVGAVSKIDLPFRASYSSVGNPAVDFVKPDLVCFSSFGTSVSAPIITSLVAAMLQADPKLTAGRIKEILRRSASLYPYPNNYVGYGVPDARKILLMLKDTTYVPDEVKEVFITANRFELETSADNAMLFQKSGPYLVKRQLSVNAKNGKLLIKRKGNVPRSTLIVDKQVFELFWK